MKVLVIGGSGYMGKALVNQLLEQQHTVLILNRGRTPDEFGDKVVCLLPRIVHTPTQLSTSRALHRRWPSSCSHFTVVYATSVTF